MTKHSGLLQRVLDLSECRNKLFVQPLEAKICFDSSLCTAICPDAVSIRILEQYCISKV